MRQRPAFFLILVMIVASLLGATAASAQAPLRTGYGGPVGFGTDSLPTNDDGSSPAIDLTTACPVA